MKNIYYEYKIDNNDYILSWQSWNPERDKEDIIYQNFIDSIKNNPEPLLQMNNVKRDDDGRLYNVSTRENFKLQDNKIIKIKRPLNDKEKIENKWNKIKIINALIAGIKNNSDSNFLELENDFKSLIKEK